MYLLLYFNMVSSSFNEKCKQWCNVLIEFSAVAVLQNADYISQIWGLIIGLNKTNTANQVFLLDSHFSQET